MKIRLRALLAVLGVMVAMQAGCAKPRQPAPSPPHTPPMGWNSWDSGVDMTEQNIKGVIDAMVSSGMRDAGYRYVNLDAGWAAPQRGPRGQLEPDPAGSPTVSPGLPATPTTAACCSACTPAPTTRAAARSQPWPA